MLNKSSLIWQFFFLRISRSLAHQFSVQGHTSFPPSLPTKENVVETVFLYVFIVSDNKEHRKNDAEFDEKKNAKHPNHKPNFVIVHNWT